MKGSRFGVVTGVMSLLTALAFFRVAFQSNVPPLEPNELLNQPGKYLEEAVHQPVKWRPFSRNAFSEARRSSKPLLLVIGAPWSRLARFVDRQCFSDSTVANFINHDFVPVRIDGSEDPIWLSAFLPISRLRPGFYGGFQAWVLDNNGRLLMQIGATRDARYLDADKFTVATDPQRLLDNRTFLEDLNESEKLYSRNALSGKLSPVSGFQHGQVADLQEQLTNSIPLFVPFAAALEAEGDPKNGGFPEGNLSSPRPLAWQYQLRVGRLGALRSFLDPYLTSRSVDIVNGGFFDTRTLGEHPSVGVDENTVVNAQMAQVLAEAALELHEPVYEAIAKRTFDMLINDLREDNQFVSCRVGDESETERSPTYSFSPRRLRGVFSGSERDWVQTHLALNVADNTQRIPYPVSMSVYADPMLAPALKKMRDANEAPQLTKDGGFLDVNGSTAACLLRCARLWGDRARLNQVLDTVSALEEFRFESDDVVHVQGTTSPGTYIGDYLAYADAALQDYLSSGRVLSFENGLSVLKRAIEFYKSDSAGVFLMSIPSQDPLLPADTSLPEVSDSTHEACMAQIIRLAFDYGRMLGPTKEGQQLVATASAAVSRVSDSAAKIAEVNSGLNAEQLLGTLTGDQLTLAFSPRLSGLFTASASFVDPQCAFAVGPNAQPLADQLARLRPNRLVAAAVGPVREDLIPRKPGIYVVAGSVIAGPYTVQEAADVMPQSLQVGG